MQAGERASEEVRAELSLQVVQQQISEMRRIRVDETAHAAKVIRVAEAHRKEAERLMQLANNAAVKRARKLHEDQKQGIKHIGKKLDRQPAPALRFGTETTNARTTVGRGRSARILDKLMG